LYALLTFFLNSETNHSIIAKQHEQKAKLWVFWVAVGNSTAEQNGRHSVNMFLYRSPDMHALVTLFVRYQFQFVGRYLSSPSKLSRSVGDDESRTDSSAAAAVCPEGQWVTSQMIFRCAGCLHVDNHSFRTLAEWPDNGITTDITLIYHTVDHWGVNAMYRVVWTRSFCYSCLKYCPIFKFFHSDKFSVRWY